MWTIQKMAEANASNGYHFFDKNTCRFFHTRFCYSSVTYGDEKSVYFVTSETTYSGRSRKYTVRRFNVSDSTVDNVGEFLQYSDARVAKKVAKDLAREDGKIWRQENGLDN